ncbi:MAG: hypothetical protein KC589_01690 [Nanoarchaeota archaeon]|nr:hypothetical protein [Nanoarchaeota archaeon]
MTNKVSIPNGNFGNYKNGGRYLGGGYGDQLKFFSPEIDESVIEKIEKVYLGLISEKPIVKKTPEQKRIEALITNGIGYHGEDEDFYKEISSEDYELNQKFRKNLWVFSTNSLKLAFSLAKLEAKLHEMDEVADELGYKYIGNIPKDQISFSYIGDGTYVYNGKPCEILTPFLGHKDEMNSKINAYSQTCGVYLIKNPSEFKLNL